MVAEREWHERMVEREKGESEEGEEAKALIVQVGVLTTRQVKDNVINELQRLIFQK